MKLIRVKCGDSLASDFRFRNLSSGDIISRRTEKYKVETVGSDSAYIRNIRTGKQEEITSLSEFLPVTVKELQRFALHSSKTSDENFQEGDTVKLTEPARWNNAGEIKRLPAGTKLQLVSKRPEGFYATLSTGGQFFLFSKYLATAQKV
jgi:hypothetical protein